MTRHAKRFLKDCMAVGYERNDVMRWIEMRKEVEFYDSIHEPEYADEIACRLMADTFRIQPHRTTPTDYWAAIDRVEARII